MDEEPKIRRYPKSLFVQKGFEEWRREQIARTELQSQHDRSPQHARIRKALIAVEEAPPLWRVNGIGTTLLGWLHEPYLPGTIKMLWFTVLFVPVIPAGVYVVTPTGDGYIFHYQMRFLGFLRIYRWRALSYYGTVWLESIATVLLIIIVLGIVALAIFGIAG